MTEPSPGAPATLDLRLAVAAVGGWFAVLFLDSRATGVVLTVAVTGAGVTGLAAAFRWPRARALIGVVGLVGAGISAIAVPLAVRLHHLDVERLPAAGSAQVNLVVSGDVRPLRSTGLVGPPRVALDARVTAVLVHGVLQPVRVPVLILAPAEGWSGLTPGQPVQVEARARPATTPLLGAVLSVADPPTLTGRPPAYQRAAAGVRTSLQTAVAGLPEGPRGLLPGLVVGDTSGLDPVLADRFRTAGLTHLVAVSGTNCAIVVGAVVLLARRIRAGPRTTAAIAGLALLAFVLVARPSPSVVRAALMAAIALTSLATGRAKAVVPALALAVLAGLVWRPALAHDAGFLMSVLATAAIVLLAPAVTTWLRAHRVPRGLAELLAVAAVAHLVTAPVAVTLSGRVSIVAVPANMAAEPVVAAATVLGFLAALTATVAPPVGVGFAWLAGWPCRWLILVADRFGTVPGATIGWAPGAGGGWLLMLATLAFAAGLGWRRSRRIVIAAAVTALLVQVPLRAGVDTWPPPAWVFVACDVGQGDALVLMAGPGAAVVVDAGPDPVAADACLRSLGVKRVPLVLLTHLHQDHIGGLAGVLRDRQVGQVVTGPLMLPASGLAEVTDVLGARGLTLGRAPVGASVTVGAARLDFLAPRVAFRDTRSDPNNSSVVVLATVARRRILLSGDAEIEAEDDLLTAHVELAADVVKVPHHGSAYSDPRFLAAAHARLAVISVGAHNDYGHPAPSTLATLGRLGVPVVRTDLDGGIAVSTVGATGLAVTTGHRRTRTPAASAMVGAPVMSGASVRMSVCPVCVANLQLGRRRPAPTPRSTTWSARPASPRSWCCSVTRNCSCRGPPPPSSRRSAAPIRAWRSLIAPARYSTRPRWPSC